MEDSQDNGAAVTRYLLGELAEDEQRRFEEELMSGARSFEELLAAEDELVDRYVAGALAARERERFEQHFLATPERRRKLGFARTLHRYIADASLAETPVEGAPDLLPSAVPSSADAAAGDATAGQAASDEAPSDDEDARARVPPQPPPPARPPLARYAVAAVLLLLFSAAAFLIFDRARGPRTDGPVLAFTLTPGAVRAPSDGGVKQLHVAPGTGLVELRLSLAAPDPARRRYRADITTVDEDRPVYSTPEDAGPETAADATLVPVRVPAHLLTPGNYKLRLTAAPASGDFRDVATYYFTIIKQ